MTQQNRQAVVILGMHRGGTSAFAGAAVRLGLAGPRTPLPPSEDNPSGFHEAGPIVDTNYYLLRAVGYAWNVCLMLQPDRLALMLTPENRDVLVQTLRHEFGDTASFVLKDPRLCVMLPVWLPALQATGAGIRVLIVVRHPAEVVQSLTARNRLPENHMAWHWLHYMLEAERATRGVHRAVATYDQLMRDWRGCIAAAGRVAGIAWPRPIEFAAPEIDAFLAPSLRHHAAAPGSAAVGPAPVSAMIDAAWRAFRHLAGHPEDAAARASLDQVWARFARWRHATFPAGYHADFAGF